MILRTIQFGVVMAAMLCGRVAFAQTQAAQTTAAPKMPVVRGTALDRVIAIVNGDLILDSDVDEEKRFEELEPYGDPTLASSRERMIERLINRTLILQQTKLQPEDPIPDEAVEKELDGLRKNVAECKLRDCATKAGWDSLLKQYGFTEPVLKQRWQERMEVLRFIEERFRLGIKIEPAEIKAYYDKTMLPEYAKKKVTPPSLESLSPRIEEVLLQQRVSNLLSDWLKSLRAQGSVVVLHEGEVAP